ncbi:hypothetical protein B0T12DRAFT_193294 [Alternaria alternata]|jgi:hypothetical protein|nr:hypothetical protein B0T12DRAFT_193294 [Alternaria alternata]
MLKDIDMLLVFGADERYQLHLGIRSGIAQVCLNCWHTSIGCSGVLVSMRCVAVTVQGELEILYGTCWACPVMVRHHWSIADGDVSATGEVKCAAPYIGNVARNVLLYAGNAQPASAITTETGIAGRDGQDATSMTNTHDSKFDRMCTSGRDTTAARDSPEWARCRCQRVLDFDRPVTLALMTQKSIEPVMFSWLGATNVV